MAHDAVKDGVRQFAAGGSAGLVEVCLMHPLDLIKTRLQVAQNDKGMWDCVSKTFRSEGVSGFYKGILPPILAETPKRATKFFTFEQYKKIFSYSDVSPAITLSMAGLFCGFTEAVVICPFEVVKVRLQAERNVSLREQKSTAAMAREIIKFEGMGRNGLYRGEFIVLHYSNIFHHFTLS
ncbi:2-oxodicarboxylate carrier 2 domain protein [Ancylostoma duodenale]|uniref:Mitochondrial 2-oxodicarboxylate carrier n=1 Tax=Ancylostoma duodenale TaxID=51022 RepID=A0A0C2E2B7_9BILA|nr:2-oxodicarboxylate carrier 2 domain protein [Ancylostoma duodenale]